MGIAFYPNFFAWFDEATHELVRASGRGLGALLRDDGYSVPIAECGARFLAPAFSGDELLVTSTTTELKSRSFRVDHVVTRDGQEVATGFEVRVVARLAGGNKLHVARMPDDLHAWLAGDDVTG